MECGVESSVLMETGPLSFQSEVEVRASGWLLCFSDLQTESQYLSLGFYICATSTMYHAKCQTYQCEQQKTGFLISETINYQDKQCVDYGSPYRIQKD